MDDAGLLEEVLLDLRALDDALLVEDDVDVLAEAGGVVVADGLGVAEGLQDRVGLEDLLLDPGVLAARRRQVLQDQLGALRLAGARLAADDDALVHPRPPHQRVAVVADGEDVRRQLADLLLLVQLDLLRRVDRQDLVRVHRHQDGPGVRLEERASDDDCS